MEAFEYIIIFISPQVLLKLAWFDTERLPGCCLLARDFPWSYHAFLRRPSNYHRCRTDVRANLPYSGSMTCRFRFLLQSWHLLKQCWPFRSKHRVEPRIPCLRWRLDFPKFRSKRDQMPIFSVGARRQHLEPNCSNAGSPNIPDDGCACSPCNDRTFFLQHCRYRGTGRVRRIGNSSIRSRHNRKACILRMRIRTGRPRTCRISSQWHPACRNIVRCRYCMKNCKSRSDRTCSFRNLLRWRCSRIRPDTRYNSFRLRFLYSCNRPRLGHTWRFHLVFQWFHEGSKSRRRRSHEAKHMDHQSGRVSIGRNVVQRYCGCTSSTRHSCGCSFRRRLDQCFRCSHRVGKAEPFQRRLLGRRSSRPNRSRNVGLRKIH